MAYAPDARSLGDLFSDLTREITTLVRNEVALARVEMSTKISRAALFTLAACLVLVLVRAGMPAWGAALLVGLGLAAIGAVLAMQALTALRQENLAPTETIQTLKETTAWKGQTS
jgi:hypothetical protein